MPLTLYVAPSKSDDSPMCIGSSECTQLIDDKKLDVQIVWTADLEHIPGWLKGTPTLVDLEKKRAYTGQKAIDFLDEMPPPLENTMPNPGIASVSEGKITQEEVDRYIEARRASSKANAPEGSHENAQEGAHHG